PFFVLERSYLSAEKPRGYCGKARIIPQRIEEWVHSNGSVSRVSLRPRGVERLNALIGHAELCVNFGILVVGRVTVALLDRADCAKCVSLPARTSRDRAFPDQPPVIVCGSLLQFTQGFVHPAEHEEIPSGQSPRADVSGGNRQRLAGGLEGSWVSAPKQKDPRLNPPCRRIEWVQTDRSLDHRLGFGLPSHLAEDYGGIEERPSVRSGEIHCALKFANRPIHQQLVAVDESERRMAERHVGSDRNRALHRLNSLCFAPILLVR